MIDRIRLFQKLKYPTFSFTFGDKTPGSDEKIVVTVTCQPLHNETRVTLTQNNMADSPEAHVNWHMGCNLGWSF